MTEVAQYPSGVYYQIIGICSKTVSASIRYQVLSLCYLHHLSIKGYASLLSLKGLSTMFMFFFELLSDYAQSV